VYEEGLKTAILVDQPVLFCGAVYFRNFGGDHLYSGNPNGFQIAKEDSFFFPPFITFNRSFDEYLISMNTCSFFYSKIGKWVTPWLCLLFPAALLNASIGKF
jgi:hypothetical protein